MDESAGAIIGRPLYFYFVLYRLLVPTATLCTLMPRGTYFALGGKVSKPPFGCNFSERGKIVVVVCSSLLLFIVFFGNLLIISFYLSTILHFCFHLCHGSGADTLLFRGKVQLSRCYLPSTKRTSRLIYFCLLKHLCSDIRSRYGYIFIESYGSVC